MANKMLIDASHPEETRVVVLRGNRVEDFDFESASKKPLRGNIYLAKVTRVEPSLQAAFIEYGGNRHGFLAFSEIHPDYYQIPVADRQALLEEEARAHREEEEDHRPSGGHGHGGRRSRRHRGRDKQASEKRADLGDESLTEPADNLDLRADQAEAEAHAEFGGAEAVELEALGFTSAPHDAPDAIELTDEPSSTDFEPPLPFDVSEETALVPSHSAAEFVAPALADSGLSEELPGTVEPAEASQTEGMEDPDEQFAAEPAVTAEHADTSADFDDASSRSAPDEVGSEDDDAQAAGDENVSGEDEEGTVEQLGGDAMEETSYRAPRLRRHYKIQEVIKRRQILLVQVVKEERGNKGAALTTYLSLAGRYSVLMPNTARGGGISRKITDADDRRRLKAIAQELEVPEGMGIILRTAGAARGENEVKRDFEYLLRMWETVRETTLSSSAPKLVYEEGSLIKRSIRDLYSKEIDEICVSGDAGYREAKDYMRLLMPTHVKNVQPYKDPQPIFAKSGAEAQLDAMFSNHVTLKSGGYIVINQTEALVAIDVNSGRSTREHNIEDTALRTNLEAADEVARQLRLRDLAGLIVVDFIDMEEGRNNRAVERRIKDALKNDRARIQIGRISHFGLLEMSRQRIRTGVLEGSTVICPHCAGAGTVRSTSSIALHVLRVLEDTLIRSAAYNLIVRTRTEVALYILNQKRANLADLEHRFGVTIVVMADGSLTGTVYHAIERGELATPPASFAHLGIADDSEEIEDIEAEVELDSDEDSDPDQLAATADDAEHQRGEVEDGEGGSGDRRRRRRRRRRGRDRDTQPPGLAADDQPSGHGMDEPDDAEGTPKGLLEDADESSIPNEGESSAPEPIDPSVVTAPEAGLDGEEAQPEAAEPRRRRRRRGAGRSEDESTAAQTGVESAVSEDIPPAPRRSRRSRSRASEDEAPSLLGFAPPSADRDVGADTAKAHTPESEPAASDVASTEAVGLNDLALEPVAANESVAIESAGPVPAAAEEEPPAAAEPPRPKRSGWWQRAKATLTGE